ncbi:MAG: CDP-diacylglycerol--glycerol-3-phosphate 3-phosphatidyltransferase [Polyangiales bacterium]
MASEVPPSSRAARRERRRKLTQDAWNIPNILTYARVAMIPGVLYLLDRGTKRDALYAALLYALAGITDVLDGFLARKMNIVSVIGKFLDPLADKLMVTASLVWMVTLGRIPAWAVILLLSREISITALRAIASSEGFIISANEGGKQKTALQVMGILFLIIGYPYHLRILGIDLGIVDMVIVGRALVYLSLIMSFTSAAEYVALFARAVDKKEAIQDAIDAAAPEEDRST